MLNLQKDLAEIADNDDRERTKRIREAWEAYYGQSPEPLRRRPGEVNDNVRLNYARLIVDAGVAHLFGDEVMLKAQADAPDTVQAAIDDLLRRNGDGLLWQRFGMSGAIGGTVFYRLAPQPDGKVRIICLDPQSVDVEHDADDYEQITSYKVSWIAEENGRYLARRQVIQRDGAGAWIILDQEATDGGWVTTGEEPWPHAYAPVGHAQNLPSPHEVYGISDLEPDVLHLCLSIERVASNVNRIVRLYAHPRTWGRMIGDSLHFDANPGSIIRLEHPDATLQNLEMQSDLASSIDLYRRLVSALHETTRIPEVATGKLDNAGQLSGLALRILYAPLIQKTETKRRTYGQAIVEMMRRALDLEGLGDEHLVEIGWPALVPSDPEGERRSALVDSQLGVSRQTILDRLGYDPAAEMLLRAQEEAEAAQEAQRAFDAGRIAP